MIFLLKNRFCYKGKIKITYIDLRSFIFGLRKPLAKCQRLTAPKKWEQKK